MRDFTKEEAKAIEEAFEKKGTKTGLFIDNMRDFTKEEAIQHDKAISKLFKFDEDKAKDITARAKETMIKLLESIRDYEHESGHSIYDDERTSEELVDIFLLKHEIEECKDAMRTEKRDMTEMTAVEQVEFSHIFLNDNAIENMTKVCTQLGNFYTITCCGKERTLTVEETKWLDKKFKLD